MTNVSSILMIAFGFAAMFAMRYTPDWGDFILVRVAGFSFIAGGLAGVGGWVGSFVNGAVGWIFRLINELSSSALGTGIGWMVAAGISFLWIGGMLPGKVFDYDPPDWLVIAGIIVPGLVAMVPGKAGNAADTLLTMGGNALANAVGGLFS